MSKAQIATRYARALFKFSENNLAQAEMHCAALSEISTLFDHSDSAKILSSPVMPLSLKLQILDYGLKQVDADEALVNLLKTVADAGRVTLIPNIYRAYRALLDEHANRKHATVTFAQSASEEEVEKLKSSLSQLFSSEIDMETKIEPSLLGGFVVKVGNKLLDFSLKSKLEALASTATN